MVIQNDEDTVFSFLSASPSATGDAARLLGSLCRGGEVLLLSGDLGAGKTHFVQGVAEGLEVPAATPVTSPTFTLHAEYVGRLVLNHVDLYRLEHPAAMEDLGIEEMLHVPGAVFAAEWPEFVMADAAANRLLVILEHDGETRRRITFSAAGERHRQLLRDWLTLRGKA